MEQNMPIELIDTPLALKYLPFRTHCEMSDIEQNFLYHLLNKYSPKKILEIGVAAGGTSCLILKNISPDSCLYSLDISQKYYRDNSKKCGYVINDNCTKDELSRHKLFLGLDIINMIGKEDFGDFDFVIIDTMHILPGEVLQFLCVCQIMLPNAVLVLHDIGLNILYAHRKEITVQQKQAYATNVLFSTLVSECKMLPKVDEPNIGALIIDANTRNNLDSLFMTLLYPWEYYPDYLIMKYAEFIRCNYSDFCYNIFIEAAIFQKNLLERCKS